MAKLLNFSGFIEKIAINQYKIKSFSNEWQFLIGLVAAIRLITIFLSGYGSYFWYYDSLLVHTELQTISLIIALLFCLLIEFAANFLIFQFFKYLFRKKFLTALFSGVGALVCFSVSFIATTNGLAQKQAQKIDKTTVIVSNTSLQIDSVSNVYQLRMNDLDSSINLIKNNPAGWSGGHRSYLLPEQQNQISIYGNEKIRLKSSLDNEISILRDANNKTILSNEKSVLSASNKFYNIAIVILIFQILTGFSLMFFWRMIYYEKDIKGALGEEITELRKQMFNEVWSNTKNDAAEMIKFIFGVLAVQNNNVFTLPESSSGGGVLGGSSSSAVTPPAEKNTIGFKNNNAMSNAMRNNIETPENTGKTKILICGWCGTDFEKNTTWHKYCCEDCKIAAYEKRTGKKYTGKRKRKK